MRKLNASDPKPGTRAEGPDVHTADEGTLAVRVSALLSATRILVESGDAQSAILALVESLCETLRWDVGEAWWWDPAHDRLSRVSRWCAEDVPDPRLVDEDGPKHLSGDDGLPGKVWRTGRTAWSQNIRDIEGSTLGEEFVAAGLTSVLAFPIRLRNEVLGVLVFYSREERVPDQALIDMLEILGSQLGVFVERLEIATDLAESEQRFRVALEAGSLGAWEWDIESGRVDWSTALEKIHGIPEGSFGGTLDAFRRDIHPEDVERVSNSITQALEGGEYSTEYRIVRPDGAVRWLSARGRLIRSASGQPARLVGVCSDITEKRQYDERTARLAAIVESSDDAIYSKTLDGIITGWNQGAERMYGYTADEMIGKRITMIMPEDRKQEEERILDQIRKGERVNHYETLRQHKDGRLINISVSVSPIKDARGRVIGASAINRDITAIKRHEQALSLMVQASEVFAAALQDREMMMAAVGRLIVPAIADWCSIDLVEKDGSIHCAAVVHDDPEKVEAILDLRRRHPINPAGRHAIPKVIRTGKTEVAVRFTDRLITALSHDENIRQALRDLGLKSAVCVPIISRGQTLGVITLVTAESGRRMDGETVSLAEELGRRVGLALDNASLLRQLKESIESKDEFLSLMSHELRTPITSIYGGARVLRTRGRHLDHEDREQVLIDIENESERMFRMVENLLALSRTELGQRPRLEPVLVQRIINKVVAAHRERYKHRHIETDIAEGLRPVEGLSTYVEQVLRNLLGNTEKYTPNDTPIVVRAESDDGRAVLSVIDAGPGLDDSEVELIFERFYRAGEESKQVRGLGLGLTVCKRLVEAMGGTIWAESQKPTGLKIAFALPFCSEAAE